MSEQPDPFLGRTIRGTIQITKRIGEGGMGLVYEAYQAHLERKLAVKVMTPEHARNPVAADYFLREAQSAAKLRHPNIIQIIDFGKEGDDTLFLAMEFIPGQPLSSLLEDAYPLKRERIIEIFCQTLSGLEEAHAHHIVHRDLKPDNLMVETTRAGKDHVKILDFGIAHLRDNNSKGGVLTQQGAILGTPHYMSPEQARGQRVDGRSDLFSMGVILYEVLAGELPFKGSNMPEILMKVMTHHAVPPSALRTDVEVDSGLEAICMRAMKKDEHLRYQTAAEFRVALERLVETPGSRAAPAAEAKFIFKRRGSSRKDIKPVTAATVADKPAQPRKEEVSVRAKTKVLHPQDAHVVDVADLFSTMDEQEPELPADAPPLEAPVPHTPPAEVSSVFGMDIKGLREDLLGERRHVSILVLHQRMYSSVDAEDVFDMNHEIEAIIQALCQRWQGQVQSHQGGYFTVFFGFANPRGDDHVRAAHMALALRASLRKFSEHSMACSIALTSGEVFCPGKEIGRAAGQALSTATEAAQKAPDSEIVIPEETLQVLLGDFFNLGGALSSGERALVSVRQASETQLSVQEIGDGDVVGREREMAVLLNALGRLTRGQGGLLCVTGEGGCGKSAVIAQLVKLADQRDVACARARKIYHGAYGVRELLRQCVKELLRAMHISQDGLLRTLAERGLALEYGRLIQALLAESFEELATFKGSVQELQESSNMERATEVAVRKLFSVLSTSKQLIIVLDQLTEFDELIQGLCRRLTEHLSQAPVLCVIGLRTQAGGTPPVLPPQSTSIHLEALSDASSMALFRARLNADFSSSFMNKLVRLSAGNPLQIEQLLGLVQQSSELSIEELEAKLADSHDIKTLMRLRLFSLPAPAQNVLALLSVLGDATEAQMLFDLASASWEPEDAMQSLYDQGLLSVEEHVQGARLFFTPPALRVVVYKNLSRKNKVKIHERAAKYLHDRLQRHKSLSKEERLAFTHHLEKLQRFDLALQQLDALYNKAYRSFQYNDAQELLERMKKVAHVANAEDVQLQARFELDLARIASAQGHGKQALDRVLKLDRSKRIEAPLDAEVRLELAKLWLEQEDPSMLEKMLRTLSLRLRQDATRDTSLRWMFAHALTLLASTLERQNNLTQSAQVLMEVIEFMEQSNLSASSNPLGPSLVWSPLNQLGRIRLKSKDMAGAFKMFQLALNSARQFQDVIGEITVRGNLATLMTMQDRFDEANRHLSTALKLARKSGQVRDIAKLLYNQGVSLTRQRRHEQAKGVLRESEEICRELDWREGLSMVVHQLKSLERVGV